jgi:hypothetical protein
MIAESHKEGDYSVNLNVGRRIILRWMEEK